jgi:hypothetical protein
MVQLLWKAVGWFLKNLEIEIPWNSTILLLDIHLKELKAEFQRNICTSVFIEAQLTIVKRWKPSKYLPTDDGYTQLRRHMQWKTTHLFFFSVLGFELRIYTLSHSTNPFFSDGFFQDSISLKYLPGNATEPRSSRSLPSEKLGLQVWATSTQLYSPFKKKKKILSHTMMWMLSGISQS